MMHDHGPEDGDGLNCNELLMPDGSRKGKCLLTSEELDAHRAARGQDPTGITPEAPTLDEQIATEAERILFTFLASIPAVRVRASGYARTFGTAVDLSVLTAAASDGRAFDHKNMLALVRASIEKVISRSTVTAEEAWADHSIGMAWDSEEHRYGEYRQFLSGFEYRDGLTA